MNKENIRKELKRLDGLIFEARMCLSVIEKEFYGGMTITNEYGTIPLDKHDESEDPVDVKYTGEAVMTDMNSKRNVVLPE